MQRPRRTSEFQDDAGCVRRQSKAQQRNTSASPLGGSGMVAACTSGTAKKYATRQSRIAVPSRPSSNDRSNNHYFSTTNAVQRGVTPQKTPMQKTATSRVLFTAEKQRTGQGVPLHNDNKWVQEQTHRITEHLVSQNTLGGNINTDFLNRGLRQMSIKQFVAIINYFLRYIWGNRFTVGNNHVDDIVNILQKLQYPYPVNKSWLKTPNTQHSFGNVIVLLDFLMDFVPTNEQNDGMYFEIKEPEVLSASKTKENSFQIPDLDFQRELLRDSEKGFMLWDKQKNDEFSSLKLHTCNLLIQKKCGVANLEELEIEIDKLRGVLKSLEKERPSVDEEMYKMKSKLSRDLEKLRHDIKSLQDKCDKKERDLKERDCRKMVILKEVDSIKLDIKSLQATLSTQSCTIEQRDQMIAEVVQYKQMLAIEKRTIQDLQNRYHNEQILQSKALKQLNDQIENFNTHMREIKFSNLTKPDENDIELSLRPKQTELNRLTLQLEEINKRALKSIHEHKQKLYNLQEQCKKIKNDIDIILCPKLRALCTANSNTTANLQKLVNEFKKDELELLESIQYLDEDLATSEKTVNKLQSLIKNKKSMVQELIQANEQTMQHAEQKHQQCLEQRRAFLKAYDEMLEKCIQVDVLEQLTTQVQLQEKILEELKQDFKN